MRKIELENLLEKTVAEALGVELPAAPHRPQRVVKQRRHALPRRSRHAANHHQRVSESA